ncbi:hypothetical protein [Janthinobacterium aquaticum]|uniref:hypothetical protein n=1 Tax=Janthinobacterium sp. FT58W TaxID=2654254 RepID=UPI0012655633|nr:hypothetical protein [Janthinobacterium sp. FT58W]KAB8043734.1 hypothetical protein GCM43_05890 [Janthinobacterium sp. FT58W]
MKKMLLIVVLAAMALYAFKIWAYDPFMWKKAMKSPEHALKPGSTIFANYRASNGSQSTVRKYFIFKVTEINGDHVRLSVVRQLSEAGKPLQSDFSTTEHDYQALKKTINSLAVTGILREDLYRKDSEPYVLNDYLKAKYPALNTSRYYFEELPAAHKNQPVPNEQFQRSEYFSLLYSKKEIIEHGRLAPWVISNGPEPEIFHRMAEDIDVIIN